MFYRKNMLGSHNSVEVRTGQRFTAMPVPARATFRETEDIASSDEGREVAPSAADVGHFDAFDGDVFSRDLLGPQLRITITSG